MGIYMGARIKHPKLHLNPAILYPALAKVVLENSALSTVIKLDTSTDTYSFLKLSCIDLNCHAVWHQELSVQRLEKLICEQVSSKFSNIDTVPPWRLWITPMEQGHQLSFFFHHSAIDGNSAKEFLLALREALNLRLPADPCPILDIPLTTRVHPSIETLIDLPSPAQSSLAKRALSQGWVGAPVLDTVSPGTGPVQTRSHYHLIPASEIKVLAAKCKYHKSSITTLLAALVHFALDMALAENGLEASKLTVTIPRNLRPLVKPELGLNPNCFGDFIMNIEVPYRYTEVITAIWETAAQMRRDLQSEIYKGSDLLAIACLGDVANPRENYQNRIGLPRSNPLEMSSLVIDEPIYELTSKWILSDFSFLQGADSNGSPITCSAISQKGGSLNLSFSWASSIVPDNIMNNLFTKFANGLKELVQA